MADNRGFLQKLWDGITKALCPRCDKHGGQGVGIDVIRSYNHYMKKVQEQKQYNANGEYIGSETKPIQVLMNTVVYDQHYKCDYCGNTWKQRQETTTEA